MPSLYYKTDRFKGKFGIFYKLTIKFLCALIPSKMKRKALLHQLRYDYDMSKAYKEYKTYKNYTNFDYYLTVTATIKNEADYIPEWIEYYKLMGVEHFYIYDNNSTDNIDEVIAPYVKSGVVTFIKYPGLYKQREIYNHALMNYRLSSKWMIIVDLDEFVLPKKHKTIVDYLKDNEAHHQILMPWLYFGNSGHISKPEGLVIENYLNCAAAPRFNTKAIIRPTKTLYIDVHYSMTVKRLKAPIKDIQCNHYFVKSQDEYIHKKAEEKIMTVLIYTRYSHLIK